MKSKVTINDIAKMCNVSKSSVSRYLNNGYVSKENAEKIKQAIEETGFQTNFFAARLKSQRSHLIGIMVSSMTSPEVGKILNGISKTLLEYQYQGIIMVSGDQIKKEKECINSFHQQGVDGILFVNVEDVEVHREQLKNLELPVIFANQICTYADSYSLDETKAATLIAEELYQKQHMRMVYLKSKAHPFELRKDAILRYYMKNSAPCDLMVVDCMDEYSDMYDKAKKAVEKKTDVIICDHDEIAYCIMKYLHQIQIRIPQDIAVVSFGGRRLAAMCTPSLVSAAFDYEGFGKQLVKRILSSIEGKPYEEEIVDIHLLDGGSI